MKSSILYHGSPKKLIGKKLIPRTSIDLGKRKENMYKAIYSTDIKKSAIAMAIICSKGVNGSSLDFKKSSKGVIYNGWPKQKIVYLHILPSNGFKETKNHSHQFYCTKPVKPISTIKISVKENLKLIRKATKKELLKYCKKFNLRYYKDKIVASQPRKLK